jgi:hypothetical protein
VYLGVPSSTSTRLLVRTFIPSTYTMIAFNDVPPEIWAKIIGFLSREQAWVTDERDDDIHQQDLAVAMRVCKVGSAVV